MSQGYTKGMPIDVDGTLSQNTDLLVPSQKAVKTYVDTGLATKEDSLGYTAENSANKENATIDTSTTKYPTVNLLKTGLDAKQDTLVGTESVLLPDRLLFKQNTAVAHTGVTGETVIATYLVPANTIQANDILKWFLAYQMTNNANTKEVKCYFNTTANLSGSPIQVAVRNNVSLVSSAIGRELVCNNSQNAQKMYNNVNNFNTTENAGGIGFSLSLTIDFTVNQYLIVTANLGVGTDTLTMQYLWAKLMR